MAASHRDGIGLATPDDAHAAATSDPGALLVDVRTRAEWTFVGAPDLSAAGRPVAMIEWLGFPEMRPNPAFFEMLDRAVAEAGASALYFICRSGARSQSAAEAAYERYAAEGREIACFNVVEGFEGDLDAEGRRGRLNGWKARDLPWRQS